MTMKRLELTTRRLALFAATLAALAIHSTAAHADLIGYWKFDDDVLDSSGKGNNGTLVGGPTYDADVPPTIGSGKSLSFDGAGDYVRVTQNADLPLTNHASFTVSAWVKGRRQDDNRIIAEGVNGNNTPFFAVGTHPTTDLSATDDGLGAGEGQINVIQRDFVSFTEGNQVSTLNAFATTSSPTPAWHHLMAVVDNGAISFYVDGVADPSNGTLGFTKTSIMANNTTIGGLFRAAICCEFDGKIDDMAIYSRALGQSAATLLAGGIAPTAIVEPAVREVFKIDVDTNRSGAALALADGFISLNATQLNGSYVEVDDVKFTLSGLGADATRVRTAVTNPLTRDLVFNDSGDEGIFVSFGEAGSLKAGVWEVKVYSYDTNLDGLGEMNDTNDGPGAQIMGVTVDGVKSPKDSAAGWDENNPASTFTFVSDGVSAYQLYVEENNNINRARLNGFELSYVAVPEPSSAALALIGLLGGLFAARRKRGE